MWPEWVSAPLDFAACDHGDCQLKISCCLSRQGKDACRGDSGKQSCLLGFKGWRAQTVTSAWSSQRAEPAWQSGGERTLRGSGNQHLCLLSLEDPVDGSAKGEQRIKGDGVCALTSHGMCLARVWIP